MSGQKRSESANDFKSLHCKDGIRQSVKTVQVLLTTPDYDWERKGFWVNEGPAVIHHDGKMFLTYSASETGVDYCVGMLSIDEDADILDPRCGKKSVTRY